MTTRQDRREAEAKLYQLIRDVDVAMLTTAQDDGRLHTRPMATRLRDKEKDLWFFTAENTAKVREIEHDQQVAVGYADPHRNVYVAISGRARVTRDRSLIAELWTTDLRAWFPAGPTDPNLALVRVEIETAEYWDEPSYRMVELIAALENGEEGKARASTGEHARVQRG